jgi:glucose-1-phosphate thymidylyltransferase
MWGIVPAAGRGSRIQPLAFSKELLPLGRRIDASQERPCAVSEYLLERMVLAGADKICIVVSPGKSDIIEYFGSEFGGAAIVYVVQQEARGLCDAIFRAAPLISTDEMVVIGLPDTVWLPAAAICELPRHILSFLLFPVEQPQLFDAVVVDEAGYVREIQVKTPHPASSWIWGAFGMPGHVFAELHRLWRMEGRNDEYIGTLVNAYLASGGTAVGVKAGEAYVDVGTLDGYRAAMRLLADASPAGPSKANSKGKHILRARLLEVPVS